MTGQQGSHPVADPEVVVIGSPGSFDAFDQVPGARAKPETGNRAGEMLGGRLVTRRRS
jgi:hypothetical protein